MPILVSLQSSDRQHYLSAVNGGGGDVMANKKSRSNHEKFWLSFDDPIEDIIYLQTFDKKYYVTAEWGGGAQLVANRTKPGPWERFKLEQLRDGLIALKACSGHYVCFERNGKMAAKANRTARGPWESIVLLTE